MRWILLLILLIPLSSGFNFELDEKIYTDKEFEITLFSNDSNIYDVKIDIIANDKRISRILHDGEWQSTMYYAKNRLKEEETFRIRTEGYTGIANITIKIRDSDEKVIFVESAELKIIESLNDEKDINEENEKKVEEDKAEHKNRVTKKDLSFLNKSYGGHPPKLLTPQDNDWNKANEIIHLTPQTIKTKENTPIIDKGYMKYSFFAFSAIMILLFMKKGKKKENEFR